MTSRVVSAGQCPPRRVPPTSKITRRPSESEDKKTSYNCGAPLQRPPPPPARCARNFRVLSGDNRPRFPDVVTFVRLSTWVVPEHTRNDGLTGAPTSAARRTNVTTNETMIGVHCPRLGVHHHTEGEREREGGNGHTATRYYIGSIKRRRLETIDAATWEVLLPSVAMRSQSICIV